MELKNIEKFFLNTLLRVALVGVFFISLFDIILYPGDRLSIIIDLSILVACAVAYIIRLKFPILSVLILTLITSIAMLYQCIAVPLNTTTSLAVILVVGFVYSIMLSGKLMNIMHGVTIAMVLTIFAVQITDPVKYGASPVNEGLTIMITYSVLYFILTYTSAVLKMSYDKIYFHLRNVNRELSIKAIEIVSRNDELTQAHNELNALNKNLERIVSERTERLRLRTKKLVQYSYTNAHHLRGPVARLLGLIAIQRIDPDPNYDFFFEKVEQQAMEIDDVVKHINVELDMNEMSTEELI